MQGIWGPLQMAPHQGHSTSLWPGAAFRSLHGVETGPTFPAAGREGIFLSTAVGVWFFNPYHPRDWLFSVFTSSPASTRRLCIPVPSVIEWCSLPDHRFDCILNMHFESFELGAYSPAWWRWDGGTIKNVSLMELGPWGPQSPVKEYLSLQAHSDWRGRAGLFKFSNFLCLISHTGSCHDVICQGFM